MSDKKLLAASVRLAKTYRKALERHYITNQSITNLDWTGHLYTLSGMVLDQADKTQLDELNDDGIKLEIEFVEAPQISRKSTNFEIGDSVKTAPGVETMEGWNGFGEVMSVGPTISIRARNSGKVCEFLPRELQRA